ncbi:MAG: phosphogluconate dehydrogenase (NAD(+)-dependent, decarboxylating) [Candidatus Cyclobacteriaceae bacterium M2_1C_046]
MAEKRSFGIVGLGLMGGSLAQQAIEKGYKVVGFEKGDISEELLEAGVVDGEDFSKVKEKLDGPRVVFMYVPAGPIVDAVIDQLLNNLEKGDIIVDGGNSYWGDSIRRAERCKEEAIYFMDCGTSGGIQGARNGACFMTGGEDKAVEIVEPILKDLAVKDGYVHTGPPGSGHYVKLVHNGIEFGMLQAIGEGMALIDGYREKLPVENILKCWNNGSVIRSWLIELMGEQYLEQKGFKDIPPYIEDTGEVNWLVNDAMHMEVPVPVIAQSVMQLFTSRDKDKTWSKAIAMMRHGFGGHPFGPDKNIKKERKEGRIGQYNKEE